MSETLTETAEDFMPFEPSKPAEPAAPTPDNPPWSSGIAFGVWLLSVALIVIMPALFLTPYAISQMAQFPDSGDLIKTLSTDPKAIIIQIAAIIPAHIITLAIAWIIVTKGRQFSFTGTLGWQSGGMRWWHYVAVLAGFFSLAALLGYVLPEQENELTRILKSSRYVVYLVALMATFTAPLVEEVIYRGILYSALQRTIGVRLAVALVTLLFALVHVPQYYESVSTLILLTLLSLVLTLIRVKTNNLLPCVVLHTVFNGFQSILLILGPYARVESTADDAVTAISLMLK